MTDDKIYLRKRRRRLTKIVDSSDEDEDNKKMKIQPIILNTDESRLFYSERYKRTLDFKGSKRVTADTSGGVNEKKAVTLILAATQFGKLYPPIVILGGKSIEKKKIDKKKKYTEEEMREIKLRNKEIERLMALGEEWKPSAIEKKKDPKAAKILEHYRK